MDSDNGLVPIRHQAIYLNQCWIIVNWTLGNKLQWNFNQNTKLFICKNASENIVCEMASIVQGENSCRTYWVKCWHDNQVEMDTGSQQFVRAVSPNPQCLFNQQFLGCSHSSSNISFNFLPVNWPFLNKKAFKIFEWIYCKEFFSEIVHVY